MMRKEQYETIERYLDKKMDSEELHEFNKKIIEEQDLAIQVSSVKEARALLHNQSIIQFKDLIQKEGIKYEQSTGNRKIKIFSALLLIVGCVILYTTLSQVDSKKPFKEFKIKADKKNVQSSVKDETTIVLSTSKSLSKREKTSAAKEVATIDQSPVKPQLPIPAEEVVSKDESGNIQDIPQKTEIIKNQDVDVAAIKDLDLAALCKAKSIQCEITTVATCKGSRNGQINIDGVSGGKEPYVFTLNSIHQKKGIFRGLAEGRYQATIIDADGCEKNYSSIVIHSETCKKDFEFNPLGGEVWEVPLEWGAGQLSIYDASGNKIFSKKILKDTQESWTGLSQTGNILPGYYLYVMEMEEGTIVKGSITIAGK